MQESSARHYERSAQEIWNDFHASAAQQPFSAVTEGCFKRAIREHVEHESAHRNDYGAVRAAANRFALGYVADYDNLIEQEITYARSRRFDARKTERDAAKARLTEHRDSQQAAANGATPTAEPSRSIAAVLQQWRAEGPLIHEPTGFATLDKLTGGGPVYGSRWYFAGQPNAFKTGMQLQIAHNNAKRGVVVGLLAVDEEDTDIMTRLAQRVGHSRQNCEIRDPSVLAQIEAELANLPIRFYNASWTIEAAAADLASYAKSLGETRMMLGVDSLQTVRCDAEVRAVRELSEMAAVTARVQAVRKVASQYRLIALVTSEMSRSAYRKADPDDLTSTMAASKHSGAVEYSARVLIGLRSVKGESDLIEVDIAKNKHGPSGEVIHLRVDRASQSLWEETYEAPPAPTGADRKQAKVTTDAASIARLILANPGIGIRQLRAKASAQHSIGKDAVDVALARLGPAVMEGTGKGNSKPLTLDVSQLPADLKHVADVAERGQPHPATP